MVFVEVGFCGRDGGVKGVDQGGIVGAEGEFVDLVGEVEGYGNGRLACIFSLIHLDRERIILNSPE